MSGPQLGRSAAARTESEGGDGLGRDLVPMHKVPRHGAQLGQLSAGWGGCRVV